MTIPRIAARRALARLALAALALLAAPAFGQPATDPLAVLARAKAASGGAAWDRFVSQHSKVRIASGGRTALAERWVDIPRGRSMLTFEIGNARGAQGFDGRRAWSREGDEPARAEISSIGRELAVNASYRDRLAFWFPDRGRARIEFKEHVTVGVTGFDVVRITPEGGRPFEFWVNSDTGLIERLVEPEAVETRTESYGDFREVQGVKVPFRVRSMRSDDPRTDEIVTVLLLEYNVPVDAIAFAPEGLAPPEYAFPEGRTSVSVPIEIHNGHVYVRAKIDGKGPFTMLFVPGGVSVVVPDVARAVAKPGAAEPKPAATIDAESLDVGGLVVSRPRFTVVPPKLSARRAEGVAMQGMVGLDLARRFPVRLDYAARTLTIYDPDAFRYEGPGKVLPLESMGAMPLVRARVAGVDGVFGLDVGQPTSVMLARPFWSAAKLDEKLKPAPEQIVDAGPAAPVKARPARAPSLELAGATIRDPVVLLASAPAASAQPDLAGTLGFGVLRRFAMVLDAPHDQLVLEPNAAMDEPDPFDRSGMWIEPADNGFSVFDVFAGGPAAQAGLKAGDAIVALDGQPAATMALALARERLRAAPGTKVRAKLGNGREVVLALREQI